MKLKSVLYLGTFVFALVFFQSKVYSQTPQAFDTYTINLSGNELNNVSGLVINIAFVGGQAVLNKGVTFKGTGALALLNTVDTTNNVISIALGGMITDGKTNITGMIKAGSITGNPTISVTKVQASGGVDITNSLGISVKTSSSVKPTPTPSPTLSASPSPTLTPLPTPKEKKPSLTLTGPNVIALKIKGLSSIKLKASGSNFKSTTKCQAISSDKKLAQVRPAKFLLSPLNGNKTLSIRIHPLSARDLVKNNSSREITVSVNCSNQTEAKLNLLLKS